MAEDNQQQNPLNPAQAVIGMNLNNIPSQIKKGQVSYALNAIVEGYDGNSVTYQNELGNTLSFTFPEGYKVCGKHPIYELDTIIWFLVTEDGRSEIGKSEQNIYTTIVNNAGLAFDINYPIMDVVHRITNCSTEIYWNNGKNPMRYMDINNPPLDNSGNLIVNRLSVQPHFTIPQLAIDTIQDGGTTPSGVYQFAIQYANANGEAYTSYYSITNPVPLFNVNAIGLNTDYEVSKSISIVITNIDTTGIYEYFNLAVIKTVNDVASPELVGTYRIDKNNQKITYNGQGTKIALSIDDIFQKYPVYDTAKNLTTVNDILIHSDLKEHPRLNYQSIASSINLKWQTWRIPLSKGYSDPLTATKYKSYMRDEVYPFELVFLLTNGKQTDGFPIAGRKSTLQDNTRIFNADTVDSIAVPTWKVYNTASISDFENEWKTSSKDNTYFGPYQYGEFAYVESTETYPNIPAIYGDLAGKPIRHHKFPDNRISHIHDADGNIYPIGVKLDINELKNAILNSNLTQEQKDEIVGFKIVRGNRADNKSVIARGLLYNVGKYDREGSTYLFPNYPFNDLNTDPFLDGTYYDDDSKSRFTMHSPDTSFYQPYLGSVLKLETVEYGQTESTFQQVKGEAKQKLFTSGMYVTTAALGVTVGIMSGMWGLSTAPFDGVAAMTTYKVLTDLFERLAPRINYAYQFNSIGRYNNFKPIDNNGNKQRKLDISNYVVSGVFSQGDKYILNNFQRESSVYLKSVNSLPYAHEAVVGVQADNSRYTLGCDNAGAIQNRNICAYYATIKNNVDNQYGQIGDYTVVDTGAQFMLGSVSGSVSIFGGDTFINKFGLKKKLPFFIDNRVGSPDESDVFYNEIGNVGYPKYWFSKDFSVGNTWLGNLFGTPSTQLDCQKGHFNYKTGKMYLFSYGIPYFFCESQVNVDLRQAYDGKAGDFYPHVGNGIPSEWLQEQNVSIANDNTYTYNKTFSKQNSENYFSHLPLNWTADTCQYTYPFKAIYSEPRLDTPNTGQRNNWLIYKPVAFFDFPQNWGKLVSLNGIEDRVILARFSNRTVMYNTMITIDTSIAKAAYLGNDKLFKSSPPVDIRNADTDLGYVGTQHKFFIKTEFGNVVVDAKRGQVFLISTEPYKGTVATDLSGENVGMSKFFTNNLDFKILEYYPNINVDNHYKGIGIHGVYDAKFNRLLLTKLDYVPKYPKLTTWDGNKFYYGNQVVELTNTEYFCNKSMTLSFDFDNQSWISFHSYLPNFYVGWNNFFYSGLNNGMGLWKHGTNKTLLNSFYGKTAPYIIEYPFSYQLRDEILQNVKDYTKVLKYDEDGTYIETNDIYFNKAILSNNQQTSGLLELVAKPKHNLKDYMTYPMYNLDSKTILYTKSDNFYNYNTFWSLVKDETKPLFIPSCESLSMGKVLNQDNMDYSKRSFKKAPLRAKDLKIRHILDNKDDVVMLSQFILAPTQQSYK